MVADSASTEWLDFDAFNGAHFRWRVVISHLPGVGCEFCGWQPQAGVSIFEIDFRLTIASFTACYRCAVSLLATLVCGTTTDAA